MNRLNALAALAFTLFISMMVSAKAQAFDAGGLSYNVTGAATVEVTGRASDNADTVIVIPSSVSNSGTTYAVTTIGFGAFEANALTSVIIPESVMAIEAYAFDNNALTTVTIPNGVTFIEGYAFRNNALSAAVFLGNFGDLRLDMFNENPTLVTITHCEGALGWPQTFNVGNFGSPIEVTTTSVVCATPATPVPTLPLFALFALGSVLGLFGLRKLKQ